MTSKNTLIIGTRGSALALAQADMVRAALSLRYPELDVRREIIHTTGDRRTDVPLADVARVSGIVDKGIFIKELETALLEGRIDVAVHSLKDVPSELAPGFTLAAVLPRAAVEDVLITREPDWNGSGTLATGSVRRRLMARTYWGSGLRFEDLRGNVPTRLAKLAEHPGWDAVILARAGLERLGLYAPETLVEGRKLYMRPLPVEAFIPAVGQGIVGMECRSSDRETMEMLAGISGWKPSFPPWGRASWAWNAALPTGRRWKCWLESAIRKPSPALWRNASSWCAWERAVPRPWAFTPVWKGMNWSCVRRTTRRAGKNLLPWWSAGTGRSPGPSAFVRLKNWTCADGVRSSAFSGADRDKKRFRTKSGT